MPRGHRPSIRLALPNRVLLLFGPSGGHTHQCYAVLSDITSNLALFFGPDALRLALCVAWPPSHFLAHTIIRAFRWFDGLRFHTL